MPIHWQFAYTIFPVQWWITIYISGFFIMTGLIHWFIVSAGGLFLLACPFFGSRAWSHLHPAYHSAGHPFVCTSITTIPWNLCSATTFTPGKFAIMEVGFADSGI